MLYIFEKDYISFAEYYFSQTKFSTILVNIKGELVKDYHSRYPWEKARDRNIDILRIIHESQKWGEPYICIDSEDIYVWGIPVYLNNEVIGGILASSYPKTADTIEGQLIWKASFYMLDLAGEYNLLNIAEMRRRREELSISSKKAEAIHSLKETMYCSTREIYLKEEPALVESIRKGNIKKAREILNRILLGIYSLQGKDPALLKTFILEIVILMYRTAIDAGADSQSLLGLNCSLFQELFSIKQQEDLDQWLVKTLDLFIEEIYKARNKTPESTIFKKAIDFMEKNLAFPISREDVANICRVSPSHLSRVIKATAGITFSELLNQMRIEYAKHLLRHTNKDIVQIALETGFNDQSYFTRVFHKYTGFTPKEYRNHL